MYKSLKGMPDILPTEIGRWHAMEKKIQEVLTVFGYEEIRTPLLEPTELFTRSIGEVTDVVEKEMYTFADKDGDSISLRPEGTASVIRSYVEHTLGHGNSLLKLYYMGPMFRHERPQKGRLRQFTQMGVEAIGSAHPSVDADVLMLGMMLMSIFEIPNAKLELNSVGDATCRPTYREKLQSFLRTKLTDLCDNCKRRIETNPLRVLDCKNPSCKEVTQKAPLMLEHLCAPCKEHFDAVQAQLKTAKVPFEINPRIVRGLDYYTRTAFEIVAGNLGSQNTVLAGGRYDGLAQELGGDVTPSVGFATGLERLLLSSEKIQPENLFRVDMIPLDAKADATTLALAKLIREQLLKNKLTAVVDTWPSGSSLKAALRRSDKLKTEIVIIVGENELQKKQALVKNLNAHTQVEVAFNGLSDHITQLVQGLK